MKNTIYNKMQLHTVLEVGQGIVKEGLIFFSSRVLGILRAYVISLLRSGGRRICRQLSVESIFLKED